MITSIHFLSLWTKIYQNFGYRRIPILSKIYLTLKTKMLYVDYIIIYYYLYNNV